MKKVIDDKVDVGMDFGRLLDRFGEDFGTKLGGKLGPSWHQKKMRYQDDVKKHKKSRGPSRSKPAAAGGGGVP